jgi:hypothetical protein
MDSVMGIDSLPVHMMIVSHLKIEVSYSLPPALMALIEFIQKLSRPVSVLPGNR